MKEHPDYKYRPRRKPKTLVNKKEHKYGFSMSPILSPTNMESVHSLQRNILPPLPPSGPHPPPHPILNPDSEAMKMQRTLFTPFPYPLYPLKMSSDDTSTKMAADLALLYNSSIYSQTMAAAAAAGWPTTLSHPCMVSCGCPMQSSNISQPPQQQRPQTPNNRSPSPDVVSTDSPPSGVIKRPIAYVLVKPDETYRRPEASLSPLGAHIPQHVI